MKRARPKIRYQKSNPFGLAGPIRPLQAKLRGADTHVLADMTGVHWDLKWCANVCRLLNDEAYWHRLPGLEAIEAMHDALYIKYGRCFKGGVQTAFVVPASWITELAPDLRSEHSFAISVRDKHVAHSVNDFEQNIPVAVLRRKKDGGLQVRQIAVRRGQVFATALDSMTRLRRLANKLAGRVMQEIKKEKRRLFELAKRLPTTTLEHNLYHYLIEPPSDRGIDQPRLKP